MNAEKRSNIKIKVVLGYILVFIAILASLFVAYQSYNKLLESVISLSKPDAEITRMNRVLTNLSEAENRIRIYSLTKEEGDLALYAENINDIRMELDSLRDLNADTTISGALIDSMNFLLEDRSNKLTAFVRLKRSKEKLNLSQQAIKQLSVASDSARTKIKTTTTTFTFLDTVKTAMEIKKKSLLAKLFSKKNGAKVDSLETVIKRTEVKVDTSYLPQSDSLLRNIENMLQTAQDMEELNREIISNEELRLVEENSLIWDKIKLLLSQLEKERMEQLSLESNRAKQTASNAIFIISIIIIVGFSLGILFIIFILMDISKSNYYRKELFLAKGRAEQLAKVKEDFLATMSHEIRTPLNAIIGFANQLNKTKLEKHQQNFVGILQNSSRHLLGLVNDILDLSKIEAGKLKIEEISFNPYTLIFDVYDYLILNANNKNLNFNWEYSGDPKINLICDPFRIKQILLNLGSNALKFTPEGSVSIKASVTPKDEIFVFEVKVEDTGIGIRRDKLEKIFEDFSQADSFSARKYGGTGLGLAISRRLSRMLGGDLLVQSELGKGSCFTLNIPLAQSFEEVAELKNTKDIVVSSNLKSKYFLVADDDAYSLLLLKTIFSGWGLKADFVDNGTQAFNLFLDNNYDVVLTDIYMPEMGGIELCQKIRALKDDLKSRIPIVALTANVRESDLKQYLKSGMTECMVKPFNEFILIKMLQELFGENEDLSDSSAASVSNYDAQEKLFDLTQIKQFTDDTVLIVQILNQFVLSGNENLEMIKDAFLKEDYLKVGETAHKMLSSFNQLKVVTVVPMLKELEGLLHKKASIPQYEKVKNLVEKLDENAKLVILSIQQEITELS